MAIPIQVKDAGPFLFELVQIDLILVEFSRIDILVPLGNAIETQHVDSRVCGQQGPVDSRVCILKNRTLSPAFAATLKKSVSLQTFNTR